MRMAKMFVFLVKDDKTERRAVTSAASEALIPK